MGGARAGTGGMLNGSVLQRVDDDDDEGQRFLSLLLRPGVVAPSSSSPSCVTLRPIERRKNVGVRRDLGVEPRSSVGVAPWGFVGHAE